MIPQHQAKNKETTRVVNQGTVERPARGEEGRGGDWAWLIFRRVRGRESSESRLRVSKKDKEKKREEKKKIKDLFAQVYIMTPKARQVAKYIDTPPQGEIL